MTIQHSETNEKNNELLKKEETTSSSPDPKSNPTTTTAETDPDKEEQQKKKKSVTFDSSTKTTTATTTSMKKNNRKKPPTEPMLIFSGILLCLFVFAYMSGDVGRVDKKKDKSKAGGRKDSRTISQIKTLEQQITSIKDLVSNRMNARYNTDIQNGRVAGPNCTLFLAHSTIPGKNIGFSIFAGKNYSVGDTIIMDSGVFLPIDGSPEKNEDESYLLAQYGFLLKYHPELYNILSVIEEKGEDEQEQELSSLSSLSSSTIWKKKEKKSHARINEKDNHESDTSEDTTDNDYSYDPDRPLKLKASRAIQAGDELLFPSVSSNANTNTQQLSSFNLNIFQNIPLANDYQLAEEILQDILELKRKHLSITPITPKMGGGRGGAKMVKSRNICREERVEPILELLHSVASRFNDKVAFLLPTTKEKLDEYLKLSDDEIKQKNDDTGTRVSSSKPFSVTAVKKLNLVNLQMESQCLSNVKTTTRNHLHHSNDKVNAPDNGDISSSSSTTTANTFTVVVTKDMVKGAIVTPVPLYAKKKTRNHLKNDDKDTQSSNDQMAEEATVECVQENDDDAQICYNEKKEGQKQILSSASTTSSRSCLSHPHLDIEFCPLMAGSTFISQVNVGGDSHTENVTIDAKGSISDSSSSIVEEVNGIINVEYNWSPWNKYNDICKNYTMDEVVKTCPTLLSFDVVALRDIKEGEELKMKAFSGTDALYNMIPDQWKLKNQKQQKSAGHIS